MTPQEELELLRAQEALLALRAAEAQPQDDGTDWMANYDPTSGLSALDAGLIGAGRTVDKLITGVGDLFANDEKKAETAQEQRLNDQAYARLQESHPVASTVGEIAGYAPSMFVPGGMAVQAGVGGLTGAAMYNTPEERLEQGAIDAGLSALPYGVGKLVNKFRGTDRLAARADELGYPLTPGDKLGSDTLKGVEASLESSPFLGGPLRSLKEPRQEAIDRIALEAVGEKGATDFADDTLVGVRNRIGNVFDETISGNTFQIDDAFLDQLADVQNTAKSGLLGGGETDTILDRFLEEAARYDGNIPGSVLQQWRTTLGTASTKAWRSDTASVEYAQALDSMIAGVDDLIERTLPPEDLVRWTEAREQWTAVKALERSKAIDEAGHVSGPKLANSLRQQDLQGYYRGGKQSDLYDIARLSKVHRPLPDSGTATRASIPMMLGSTVATGGLNIPAYGLARFASGVYAQPEKYAKLGAGILRGYTGSGTDDIDTGSLFDDEKERVRRRAEELRRGGF